MKSHVTILSIIVFAQFCCTSMWFACNAVLSDLITQFELSQHAIGYMTNAVQCGFIIGTLTLALLSVADRFSPSKVFFISASIGALLNLGILLESNTLIGLIAFRFGVGFCLAGIYPVGMKIASDYFENGLGKSLSYLVAALVLGTAFPHLLKSMSGTYHIHWENVIYFTSAISLIGGLLIYLRIPDGPFRRPATTIDLSKTVTLFKNRNFRSFTFGYIGHMWELYAFWAFVPIILMNISTSQSPINISLWSFIIIAIGSFGCILGGHLSLRFGSRQVALSALITSGFCCFIFPFLGSTFQSLQLGLLLVWGGSVIADSPLFSSLIATHAPPLHRGTALTIATCLGFTITLVSVQSMTYLVEHYHSDFVYWSLLIGPIFGVASILKR